MYRVVLYQNVRGDSLVDNELEKFDSRTYAKYLRLVGLLFEYGPGLRMPFSRRLTKNLSELRTRGKNPVRVIYCLSKEVYVLLHVFQKKTNKTPTREINTAEARRLTLL